ncbi:stage II sporulation protein M [Candidatus Woesearchaeota archaeon]|nr:stage II sporulation protein M [Candidatus Woesearchaeota archaeon]
MVFEQFLESDNIKKHYLFIFLLGIFYVIVSYFVSGYFFEKEISLAVVFTSTLLLTPSIYTIINIEEKIQSKQGLKHFFHNHKDIFKIFLFLFIGIFIAFVIIGTYSQKPLFDYQLNFLKTRGDLSGSIITDINQYTPSISNVFGLISQNLIVIAIAFVLSVFYGAGALFLIVLNASIFAGFILHVIKEIGKAFPIISLFLIHLIPELAGFLVAAIAGGIVSRALMKEKFASQGFKNIMRDALVLLLIAVGLIIISAFLEVFVSARLVKFII